MTDDSPFRTTRLARQWLERLHLSRTPPQRLLHRLGMLNVPAYREGWERKRRWYEERMGIPVVGPGAALGREVEPGVTPLVITSRDGDDGSIDQMAIERLARSYILLE